MAPPETEVVDEAKILALDEEGTHPSWLGDSELLKESERFTGVAVRLTTKVWSAVSLSLLLIVKVPESKDKEAGAAVIEKLWLPPGKIVIGVVALSSANEEPESEIELTVKFSAPVFASCTL